MAKGQLNLAEFEDMTNAPRKEKAKEKPTPTPDIPENKVASTLAFKQDEPVYLINKDIIVTDPNNKFGSDISIENREIIELAESIKENGLINPIVAVKIPEDRIKEFNGAIYIAIVGNKRLTAYKEILGDEHQEVRVSVLDKEYGDPELTRLQIQENIQSREVLNPMELCISYNEMKKQMNFESDKDLAEYLSTERTKLSRLVNFIKLPDSIKEACLKNRHYMKSGYDKELGEKTEEPAERKMVTERALRMINSAFVKSKGDKEMDAIKALNKFLGEDDPRRIEIGIEAPTEQKEWVKENYVGKKRKNGGDEYFVRFQSLHSVEAPVEDEKFDITKYPIDIKFHYKMTIEEAKAALKNISENLYFYTKSENEHGKETWGSGDKIE